MRPCLRFGFPIIALLSSLAQAADTLPAIEAFSPQGTVKGVRQVAVRFSAQMVPFGDPRLVEPFAIDCPEAGTARWADGRNWVYDFGRDLPAGIRCSFTLKADLRTLDGAIVTGQNAFTFSTGGPAVVQSLPYEGAGDLDEEQIFVLGLDAPARKDSILQNAYCDVNGVAEKIGVRVLTGEERKTVLDQRPDFLQQYFRVLLKGPDHRLAIFTLRAPRQGTEYEKFLELKDAADSPIVVLQCQRRFPANTDMRLVWGKGVTSASGVPTGEDQALAFHVREVFRARFSCERVNKDAQCIPVLPLNVDFTGPIARADAGNIRLTSETGAVYQPVIAGDAKENYVAGVRFDGPFPEKTRFTITIPGALKDDAGRNLTNQSTFPLAVQTDEDPPLAKFPGRFGIVELNAGAMLPVTLRNLEAVLPLPAPGSGAGDQGTGEKKGSEESAFGRWLREYREHYFSEPAEINGRRLRVTHPREVVGWMRSVNDAQQDIGHYDEQNDKYVYDHRAGETSVFSAATKPDTFTLPKPNGARSFDVIGIPFDRPGFYVVELASPRLGAALLGKQQPYHVQTAALVTNLSAHFLRGRESSLVWVTTLDKAQPAANAEVKVSDCGGEVYFEGKTDDQGIARIDKELPPTGDLPRCVGWDRAYFVTATVGEDMTFVLSNWNEGIAPWRFNLPTTAADNPGLVTTVLDRTLLRAGETVHMKHIARRHSGAGIDLLDPSLLPGKLLIHHLGSDQEYGLDLKWDDHGIAESSWEVPKDAKQGTYELRMPGGLRHYADHIVAGTLRVEAFRVPTMKAVLQPLEPNLVNARRADLDIQVNYLAGGGAGYAPVKLRSLVQPRTVSFADYEDFVFATGNVREGDERQDPYALNYAGYEMEEPGAAPRPDGSKSLATRSLTLDRAGAVRATLTDLPEVQVPQDLLTEIEYQDANGELLTAATHMTLWPAKVIVGIKPDSWAAARDQFKFQAIALDLHGKPLAGAQVQVDLFQRITYSHRKRLIGGFYAYENHVEVKRVGDACAGATDARGLLACEIKSPVDGNLILRAQAADDAGNASYANREVWVAGSGDWWFEAGNEDRMDVLPEKKRYEPGDTAVFQVRMPFRAATALIAVEREGVLETYVRPLSGKLPVVEVPVKGNYAPNVFVSVLAVRGRVDGIQPTALVDLGRPAYKLGIAEINVGWRAHELKVDLAADRPLYKVREQAKVSVKVRSADGEPLPGDAEVALAAVDEGLLELMPNKSWDLLEFMMARRGMEVETATAQMQVIGKRHYGRKARPPGGGGGRQGARELFDTLLYWQGRVRLDANGEATVEVPLNDSLTSFRIVAVANAASGKFGTGSTSIRSRQDLMLLSGLPPLVREQDRYHAGFTVRNATDHAMEVSLNAAVTRQSGAAEPKPYEQPLEPIGVALAAGEAKEVGWDLVAPIDAGRLNWEVTANGPEVAADRLKVSQKVIPAVRVRTFQATLQQLDAPIDMTVEMPVDALPARGGIDVHLRARLAGELSGVREYMNYYVYDCLEQQVSKAVALRDEGLWKSVMQGLPPYLDGDGLARYFTVMLHGSDTLTAYLLAIANEAGWEIPGPQLGRMKGALAGFVQGKIIRDSALPTADLAIRKIAAIEALSRYDAIDPAWLDSISIEPNLWPTSAVLDWLNILERTGAIPDRDAQIRQTRQIIRSRLNFQGTTMGFSTERSDFLWWLMISADANANRAILSLLGDAQWREDLPRMVRGALGRQTKGHWSTTTANAWGVLALEKFSQAFESQPVEGVTRSTLGGGYQELPWDAATPGGSFSHPWPAAADTLHVEHRGSGRPWVTVQSLAAIPLKEPFSSGYTIRRTVTPVEQKTEGGYRRGDVLRVRLEVEAQSDMTWVVVNDPIPAGAAILGTGLGRDSQILTRGEQKQGYVRPAFEERTFDAFRAYYEFVPKGSWVVEYSVRLNNSGHFELPETRVEALYSPEMFGEIPNAAVTVNP